MTKSGFTHLLNGEPLPARHSTPYVAQAITPCKTGRQAANVIAFAKGQIAPPTKAADTHKSQALRKAGI